MAKDEKKPQDTVKPEDTVTGAETPDPKVQLRVDESQVHTAYSSTTRLSGTAEEITIDFAQGIRPAGNNQAVLKIDTRVILSPWAAKRLALALGQTVQRYEQAYGILEVDPRKRAQNASTTQAS